jgi:hypothetical protein
MPVNATKRASILRFDDLPLQHLQATRYVLCTKTMNKSNVFQDYLQKMNVL